MRTTLLVLSALLFVPTASALILCTLPTTQTSPNWGSWNTVTVQPATGYSLVGVAGDHDVFFYSAGGGLVGTGIACGDDYGSVPASAATAVIRLWSTLSLPVDCTAQNNTPPSSDFTYCDGI